MKSSSRRRARQPQESGKAGRIVRAALLVIAAVIALDGIVGERGLLAMRRARLQYEELAVTLARQRAENARLRDEASRLESDPAAIEEFARSELGLIRPGEKVFILKNLSQHHEP